ncbi:tetratricopeptide repeat protein [Candidatus Uabimicrobium sp. HlEnr_7]|uniref:serine/threonine-protein kinase n=1 Tax=Candidatus Uabimicrobium helgolandensis TaxID=3095367 RepID=UPI0035579559
MSENNNISANCKTQKTQMANSFDLSKSVTSPNQINYGKTLQPGQNFGRYVIQEELGSGGMGIVYKAYDQKLQRTVALKILQQLRDIDANRLRTESLAMAQLNHPNIIRLYEFVISPLPHITMEYIEGRNLQDLIKQKKIKPLFLINLMIAICDALAHAHKNGIWHRDLKPSNIMITKSGEPKVMDFGLAKIIDSEQELSTSGQVVGTILYAAPEQLKQKVSNKSDIYSIGATIYEALTYQPVHEGDTFYNLYFQIQNDDPIPPRQLNPEISPYLEAICLKCLSKKEKKRYNDFQQLKRELKNLKNNKPILAKKYTYWDSLKNIGRRHKTLCISITTVVSILTLSFIVTFYTLQQVKEEKKQLASLAKAMMEFTKNIQENNNYNHILSDPKIVKPLAEFFNQSKKMKNTKQYKFLRGIIFSQDSRFRKHAIEEYTAQIKQEPRNKIAYNNRAYTYSLLGRHKEAINDCTKAISLDPKFLDAYDNRARAYIGFQQYSKALDDCNTAISSNPKFTKAYVRRAYIYNALKQYSKALNDCNTAISLGTKKIIIYAYRAYSYNALKQYPKALNDYNTVISLGSQDYKDYNNRGDLYLIFNEHQKALQDYKTVISLNQKSYVTYNKIGNLYSHAKKYNKAINHYSQAIVLNSRYANAYSNRGLNYALLQEYKKALDDFNKAILLDPQFSNAYANRGDVYNHLTKYKKALDDFTKALSLGLKNWKVYYSRGGVYFNLKMYSLAIKDWEEAIIQNYPQPNKLKPLILRAQKKLK